MWAFEEMDRLRVATPNPSLRDGLAFPIYAALANNCRSKKVDPDFTFEDVKSWVEELIDTDEGAATMDRIQKAMEDSNTYKYLMQEAKKKEQSELNGTTFTGTPSESLALDPMSTTT